jgi:hypothetical protein
MKKTNLYEANDFTDKAFSRLLVHDSPYFKILNFNFKAGQELPIHAHDIEGQVSLVVIEGEGEFLGKDNLSSARSVIVSEIRPHGLGRKPTCDCWSPSHRRSEPRHGGGQLQGPCGVCTFGCPP